MNPIIPICRFPITIRPGTMDDLSFIDSLQKKHTKQVGFMPTKQFEGKITAGHVLVAEENGDRIGYLIGNDQYFKHDDVGIVYQINVAEGKRRGLVGAMLLKAQFERSAYGCRLYCCWCAQDIEANKFWESMGFVPLAFRAGSRAKDRVHIFWQKRIRSGDTTTPWWFPAQTNSGSIREDRLVFPIPPGKLWSDEMPRILPGVMPSQPCLPTKKKTTGKQLARANPVMKKTTLGRLQFNSPAPTNQDKLKREPRQKIKNDPNLVAAARELRDRWLEKVNDDPMAIESGGKYEVARLSDLCAPRPSLPLIPSPPIAA